MAFWYNHHTMRAVAFLALLSLMIGCFPHNRKARTISKYAEGGSLLAGVGLEFLANSGADCQQMAGPLQSDSSCHTKATVMGDLGVALILAGMLGFVATVSTDEDKDDEDKATVKVIKADKPAEKPDVKLPPGVKAPAATTATTTPEAAPAAAATPDSAPGSAALEQAK
jgi:hypothetical protein